MTAVPALAAAAREVLSVLEAAKLPACVIGGLVVPRWGQPRATTDADFSVLAPFGEEERVIDVLLAQFQPRRSDARTFALTYRVLLLVSSGAVKIDVALAALPFEIEAIEEATPWETVVHRQGARMNLPKIRRWAREFAEIKENPDLLTPFEAAVRRAGA